MSHPTPPPATAELSTPQLLTQLSEQTSRLVKAEMALATAELKQTVKHAGVGAGLFGGAGVVALYGVGALVAAAIGALSLVLDVWLAALITAVVLFAIAGVAALLGKKQVQQATPAVPETTENVRRDVQTVQEARHRG